MGKFLIFSLLWWLTGSPIIAVIIVLVILYAVDRRYLGLFPNLWKPVRLSRRLSKLRGQLKLSPYDTSAKLETARLLIQKKRFRDALGLLMQAYPHMEHSADVSVEIGLCFLKLGDLTQGEQFILRGLDIHERVKYGEPYLWLGEAFADSAPNKSLDYMEKFNRIQSSSCEAYYYIGRLYSKLGRRSEASRAFRECLQVYRMLPGYKRRTERRWAILAQFRAIVG